ncbi:MULTISPECIES: hypothetical protein [unclassified Mucilaginibacter]|uniref:hypothetical protein n=1 Tax=unclassified Mucilaginibacter TaxID=2617802 RepID=UPI0031F6CBA6
MRKYTLHVLVLISILCFACKKDSNNSANELVGQWLLPATSNNFAPHTSSELKFDNNGILTMSSKRFDATTGQILGFTSKFVANYRIKNGELVEIYNVKRYSPADNTPYADEKNLILHTDSPDQSFTYKLNEKRTTLTWTVVCPINACCIGAQIYIKK